MSSLVVMAIGTDGVRNVGMDDYLSEYTQLSLSESFARKENAVICDECILISK